LQKENKAEGRKRTLDEERVQDTLVPLKEDVGDLALGETEDSLEDIVSLGDELHVSVLDTVVDHLREQGKEVSTAPALRGIAQWLNVP
jgi:hypothetical protein